MLGRGEKMKPGFVDLPNFAQGIGFASRKAISETREFSKTHKVRFRQGCDTGVVYIDVKILGHRKMGSVCPLVDKF